MFKRTATIVVICLLNIFTGCSYVTETAKVIWGSSTRALENARVDAISKTYKCSFNDCFDAVLDLARETEIEVPADVTDKDKSPRTIVKSGHFDIFIKNRKKRHIVVMGIKDSAETTEVGIFFVQPSLTAVKVEISSLSSSAKRSVADIVFEELSMRFSEVQ